jgi:hypothetical protein
MTTAPFPQRRGDGSFSVSARFVIVEPGAFDVAKRAVSAWLYDREQDGDNVSEDLRSPPTVALVRSDCFDVVFDGEPGAIRWKDWLVDLSQRLSGVPGVTFDCFFDHVAGAPHPGSVRRDA